MLLMHSNNREDIKEAYAGDIVALAGLKDTRTGDTLCDPDQEPGDPGEDGFPRSGDRDRRSSRSPRPTRRSWASPCRSWPPRTRPSASPPTRSSGQTILKGMGELHLDIKVDILKRTYKVEANIGAPQVAYRETLGRKTEIDYTHKKQTGGSGQFARVKMVFEPGEPGGGLRVREQGRRRLGAEGIHPRRREGPGVGQGKRPAGRLPGDRLQGDADRRRLPRRRLQRAGVRDRRARGLPRAARQGRARSCSSRS